MRNDFRGGMYSDREPSDRKPSEDDSRMEGVQSSSVANKSNSRLAKGRARRPDVQVYVPRGRRAETVDTALSLALNPKKDRHSVYNDEPEDSKSYSDGKVKNIQRKPSDRSDKQIESRVKEEDGFPGGILTSGMYMDRELKKEKVYEKESLKKSKKRRSKERKARSRKNSIDQIH